MKKIVHIRKRRVKRGGNQFYRSTSYNGPIGTLCGADVTSYDLSLRSVLIKSFDPEKHEKIMRNKICPMCLDRAYD